MAQNETAVMQGAATGALAGAAFGPVGVGVGAVIGAGVGYFSSDAQRKAAKQRAKALERLRVQNITKQVKAQESADQTAFAVLTAGRNNVGGSAPQQGAMFSATGGGAGSSSVGGTSLSGNF